MKRKISIGVNEFGVNYIYDPTKKEVYFYVEIDEVELSKTVKNPTIEIFKKIQLIDLIESK